MQIDKSNQNDQDHARSVEGCVRCMPEVLGLHQLQRLDRHLPKSPAIAPLQRCFQPTRHPKDQRDDRRNERCRKGREDRILGQ